MDLEQTRLITVLAAALALVGGCEIPAKRIDVLGESLGFNRAEIAGSRFVHVIYSSNIANSAVPLHVYIEGDGSAWAEPQHCISRSDTEKPAHA